MTNDKRTSIGMSMGALAIGLMILAIVFLVAGLAAGLTVLAIGYAHDRLGPATIVRMLVIFAGAGFLAALLWILSYLCRREHRRQQIDLRLLSAVEQLALQGQLAERAGKGSNGSDLSVKALQTTLVEQLQELNVNILLPDDQRQKKWKHLVEKRLANLTRQFDQAISSGEITEAEAILERLINIVPDSPEISSYSQRIDKAREEIRSQDFSMVQRQVENLMAAGNFAEAQSTADALLKKYPSDTQARELFERVMRERDIFITEQRQQMYRQIEKHASARHWRAALEAAKKFIQTYPNTTEADAVRAQLSTLTDNAKIEEVREMRDKIRDLLTRRRFKEALVLAHEVIDGFPDTAAADELSRQLPRLEELAQTERKTNKHP